MGTGELPAHPSYLGSLALLQRPGTRDFFKEPQGLLIGRRGVGQPGGFPQRVLTDDQGLGIAPGWTP
ncbi:protein of unknown function [Kyrpidia spormannii]|uniref:Uncharacterized protein n=1 Tax=Kyrpidia spormannii TaxID=2055160 RepID=A0A6F9EFM9_9BACL|nr:protein of unknown function [Kyrpidia spormannii]